MKRSEQLSIDTLVPILSPLLLRALNLKRSASLVSDGHPVVVVSTPIILLCTGFPVALTVRNHDVLRSPGLRKLPSHGIGLRVRWPLRSRDTLLASLEHSWLESKFVAKREKQTMNSGDVHSTLQNFNGPTPSRFA